MFCKYFALFDMNTICNICLTSLCLLIHYLCVLFLLVFIVCLPQSFVSYALHAYGISFAIILVQNCFPLGELYNKAFFDIHIVYVREGCPTLCHPINNY